MGPTQEVRLGQSRIDFALTHTGATHYVEVKMTCLVVGATAYFPDSKSVRAGRQIRVLTQAVATNKCTVLFVVLREGVDSVRPSVVHDPDFADCARNAAAC